MHLFDLCIEKDDSFPKHHHYALPLKRLIMKTHTHKQEASFISICCLSRWQLMLLELWMTDSFFWFVTTKNWDKSCSAFSLFPYKRGKKMLIQPGLTWWYAHEILQGYNAPFEMMHNVEKEKESWKFFLCTHMQTYGERVLGEKGGSIPRKLCGYTIQSGNVHSFWAKRRPILTHGGNVWLFGSEFNPVSGHFSCETNRNEIVGRGWVKRTVGSCRRNDKYIESSKNSNLSKCSKWSVHTLCTELSDEKILKYIANSWKNYVGFIKKNTVILKSIYNMYITGSS